MKPTPVTLVTGFLGAGKTTLVNRILTGDPTRMAVIENELGSVGIDHVLLARPEGGVYLIANGCACCQIRGDLVRLLADLRDRRADFDHLVVETTGVADPAPILRTFIAEEKTREAFRLDGVVCVVDALNADGQLDSVHTARAQVAFADVVVINKCDLAEEARISALEARLKGINRVAPQVRAERCQIDPRLALDVGTSDWSRLRELPQEAHGEDGIMAVAVEVEGPLDELKTNLWVNEVRTFQSATIFRWKGVLTISGRDTRLVFQAVHQHLEVSELPLDPGARSQVVFIGRHLDGEALQRGFSACVE